MPLEKRKALPMKRIEVLETWTGPGDRDEVIVPLKPLENAAHHIETRNFFEHWYFDAHLENGYVVIGFLQPAELITKKPGVELHVYKPSGEKLSVTRAYKDSDVRASESKCDVWVGDNHAYAEYPEGGGLPVYHLHIAEGNMEADLTFESEIPGWKPGAGRTNYGETEFFAWVVPAPRAKVEGTVKIADETLKARGIGYHDHNWGIGDMRRIISYWYWGRIYAGEFTLLYANVMTRKRYANACSTPFMLARGDEVILSTGEMSLSGSKPVFNKVANREYPSSVVIEVPGSVLLRLDVKDVIDAHNLLLDVSPVFSNRVVERIANRLIGRPGYFRFNSEFSLHVEHGGESYDRTGTTLHEMVALQ